MESFWDYRGRQYGELVENQAVMKPAVVQTVDIQRN
jgi:hypothetical protein